MTYAVESDLIARFGERELILLSNDGAATTIDDAVVATASADVDDAINGYLGSRYALPLTAIPAALTAIACDLIRYKLATRTSNSRPTDTVKDNYAEAMKKLRDVGAGKFSLGLTQAGGAVTSSETTRSAPPDRSFTKESLREFTPLHGTRRRRF
jgi:phage gp36-like protein